MDRDGLQEAIEDSEHRRMLLVNRLKDAQDTLKVYCYIMCNLLPDLADGFESDNCKVARSFYDILSRFQFATPLSESRVIWHSFKVSNLYNVGCHGNKNSAI